MTHDNPIRGTVRRWLAAMASPAVIFYALPWLMVLLVLGTIAQKELGIYAAQKIYFSSWILWLGPFPLPGAYLTLGIITLCLSAKFLLYSPWAPGKAGTILSHLGVLILLVGSLLTAFSQKEGYLMLREGEAGSTISDYHARALFIEEGGQTVAVPFEKLKAGEKIGADLPFDITPDLVCQNCQPAPVKNSAGRHGLAAEITLRNAPPDQSDEANLSGLSFTVTEAGDQDGHYLVMEEIPHRPEIQSGHKTYTIHIGRMQTQFPFSIELQDFAREMHPGTEVAKGFSSSVIVREGAVEWPYTIRMNEPLRYKGYTFYQASFSMRPDGEFSILSVVQNKGRIFPYIAGIIIFAGLLIHIVLRIFNTGKKSA